MSPETALVVFGVQLAIGMFQLGLLLRSAVILERVVTHLTVHNHQIG